LQSVSDKNDTLVLGEKKRESTLEEGLYVHCVASNPPSVCTVPPYATALLSNGLDLSWCMQDDLPKIDIQLEFKAKHYYDSPHQEGLYNFMTEMMIEGTQNYSAQELVDQLEMHGITLEIEPGYIWMSLPASALQRACELLIELLTKATFPRASFAKVREIIKSEISNFWDTPTEVVSLLVKKHCYGDHPFGKSLLGNEETVDTFTPEDVISAYRSFITPQGTRMAIVGDLRGYDMAQVSASIAQSWQGGVTPVINFPIIPVVKKKEIDFPMNRDQVVLCFAGISVSRMDQDFDKLLIFDQIFTGGILGSMSSRLFQLREQSGLFYTITGSLFAFCDEQPGVVYIKTIVSTDNLTDAEWLISSAIDNAVESILPEEFEQAKNAVINSLVDNFESNARTAETLLFLRRYGLSADYLNTRAARLAALTLDEVKIAAESILNKERMMVIRVGRVGGGE